MGRNRRMSPLWRIQSPNSIESYLFGTIHISNQSTRHWLEQAKYVLEYTNSCFCETDLDDMSRSSVNIEVQGFDLKLSLGDRLYNKYRAIAKRHFQVDLGNYRTVHPFWLNSRLVLSVVSSPAASSMDHSLWQFAKDKNLKTGGVESFIRQQEIFESISVKDQLKELKKSLSHITKFRKRAKQIVSIYAAGDINRLYKLSIKSMGATKNLMIYDRNIEMTRKITHISSLESSFIAIGCGHLPGEKGVLRLLKQKGFRLTPLDSTVL